MGTWWNIGDWGDVDRDDWRANNEAMVDGVRLLSAHRTLRNVRIWIITEAVEDDGQRALPLLPDKY